jgi:hypothetical protein
MPVPGHRAKWKGGDDLIVATSLYDHEVPIAFDLQGRPVTGLSSEMAPTTPTLSLVPLETDFESPCATGGGGAALEAEPLIASVEPNGLYLTHVNLSDTGEGWLRGSPEIEAMLMGPITDTMTLAKIDCANESRTGARYYNQDNHDWTGNVLVADSVQLKTIKSKYPAGTPWSKVRFTIHFWEDDTTRCSISTDVNTWKNLVKATILIVFGGAAWIGTDWSQPIDKDAWPFIASLPLGLLGLVQTLGGNDDNLGFVVNHNAWNATHPNDIVNENHAIVRGSTRLGKATLKWGLPAPPPPPFTVTASAPSFVSTKGAYALNGFANYPATGWKWEISENGGASWSVWATTQNSSFFAAAGEDLTIFWRLSAKRADGSIAYGVAATEVCTATVCGGGPIP